MNTGPVKPLVDLAPASSRFLRLPDFSSISRLTGIEAVRLISCRGLQTASRIFTSVNGSGRSLARGASAAESGARPPEARHTMAMKWLMGSILNSVSIGNRGPHPDPSGLARSRGYVERLRSLDRVSGLILPPPG